MGGFEGIRRGDEDQGHEGGHHFQRTGRHWWRQRDVEAARVVEARGEGGTHRTRARDRDLRLALSVNFAKAAPLCGAVELGLGPDAPLLVKYELEKAENGFMQFYLAPKIDE